MSSADFIPTGRTSLVKRNGIALQVQTEYAHRPAPRLTTTVLRKGVVVHKIERHLHSPIDSLERKNQMEDTIRKQHSEILGIIRNRATADAMLALSENAKADPDVEEVDVDAEAKTDTKGGTAADDDSKYARLTSTYEKLQLVPGEPRIYQLNTKGEFVDPAMSREFKDKFAFVFKNLHELLTVFSELPGMLFSREHGVYEVEQSKLYLLSTGDEMFIVYIQDPDPVMNYEQELKKTLPFLDDQRIS
ncbi:hypothetical protein GF377_08695 [candidate division GN15 bacterium]|nr:hypothetical protein [candidate division GN15 bacterium]